MGRASALRFVAVMLAMGSLTTSASAASSTLYVALGDSISAGGGAPPGKGFVERYYAYLHDNAGVTELSNLSLGGETSSSMMAPGGQLDRAVAAIDDSSDATNVTLDIGGNDGLSGQCSGGSNAPPCPFRANYAGIVQSLADALAADPGEEQFQVMQYYNPATGTNSSTEARYDEGLLGSDGRVDCLGAGDEIGLNDIVACDARDRGTSPVDAYPTFKLVGRPLIADSLHPNATGHAYLACLFEHPELAGSRTPCGPGTEPADTPPDITLMRARGSAVLVRTTEDARVAVSGRVRLPDPRRAIRFRTVRRNLTAYRLTRLALRPMSRRGALRRALRAHATARAHVRVLARDAAGNRRLLVRTIRLVG